MKKASKSLRLHRETLQNLDADSSALRALVGGVSINTCGNPCTIECSNISCTGSCLRECGGSAGC